MNLIEKTKHQSLKKGFTLLEILIAMSILMSIVLAVTTMLKNSLDIKFALSEKNTVTSKVNRVLYKISSDLSQAFIISRKDMLRDGGKGRTFFEIEKGVNSDSLRMTYMAHKPEAANSHESSLSFVVYKLQEAKTSPGRRHLYKGTTPRVPESFKEDPELKLFADNVHSIHFYPWKGDDWAKDKWDSSNGSTANKLPHMVLVEVAIWMDDPPAEGEERDKDDALERYSTIVYLGNAFDMEELKKPNKNFKI